MLFELSAFSWQILFADSMVTAFINDSIVGESRVRRGKITAQKGKSIFSFEIARSSGRDRELKSTTENRLVRAQRRERNDEVKRSVVRPFRPLGIPFFYLLRHRGARPRYYSCEIEADAIICSV